MGIRPLTITKAEAQEKLRAAYANQELVAQTPEPMDACYYASKGGRTYRCAIGAIYPMAAAMKLEGGQVDAGATSYPMAEDLIEANLLRVPAGEEAWFTEIQSAHDALSTARGTEEYVRLSVRHSEYDKARQRERLVEARANFEKLIGLEVTA